MGGGTFKKHNFVLGGQHTHNVVVVLLKARGFVLSPADCTFKCSGLMDDQACDASKPGT